MQESRAGLKERLLLVLKVEGDTTINESDMGSFTCNFGKISCRSINGNKTKNAGLKITTASMASVHTKPHILNEIDAITKISNGVNPRII